MEPFRGRHRDRVAERSECRPAWGAGRAGPRFEIAGGSGHITYLLAPRIESE